MVWTSKTVSFLKYILWVAVILPVPTGCADLPLFRGIQHFSQCPVNPGLHTAANDSFDSGSIRDNVLWVGRNKIWTLYTGAEFGIPPYNPTIGIASSSDGCNWTKGGQVIKPNPLVRSCSGGVFSPGVLYDDKTDVLTVAVSCVEDPANWYLGPISISELQVGAGDNWSSAASYKWVQQGDSVLVSSQSWEGTQGVYAPSLMKQNGTYYMYYSSSTKDSYRTGVATAPTAIGPWKKADQNPITQKSANCEEAAPISLKSGSTYLLCDTVGSDRHGMNVFSAEGSAFERPAAWAFRGVYDLPGQSEWSLGEIGSQSAVELPDGRILLTYNGKPSGTESDVRQIGFAFFKFK